MAFERLSAKGEQLVEIVGRHIWANCDFAKHVPWGYETHIEKEIRNRLASFSADDNPTARHIRFSPDFFVVQQRPKIIYLLEYKNSQTPIYSQGRIDELSQKAGKALRWQDIGQWQTAAHDNYAALQSIDIKVAILYYVAYHERLLLCDFVDSVEELFRDRVRSNTQTGSRTPYMNFDVTPMKTLQEFLVDIHGVTPEGIAPHIEACCSELKQQLPIEHHWRSPYRNIR